MNKIMRFIRRRNEMFLETISTTEFWIGLGIILAASGIADDYRLTGWCLYFVGGAFVGIATKK